ncbi:alpha-1,3-glucosyltransferase, partial [Acrasis kona]
MFAILLNFKHIYLYAAPAYFLFLLYHYCIHKQHFSTSKFLKLGSCVIIVFLISFLPFVLYSQILDPKPHISSQVKQILSRMFPFERGLTHAYWAPNFWAIYNFVDKMLVGFAKVILKKEFIGASSFSGGLVGLNQGSHAVLPSVSPGATIILSGVTATISCILVLYKKKRSSDSGRTLIECVVNSSFAFFLFGWHVHEKAVIMMLVPMGLLIVKGSNLCRTQLKWFSFASIVGCYSLFPLLYQPMVIPIRWMLLLVHIFMLLTFWSRFGSGHIFNKFETLYLYGLIIIEIYSVFINNLILPQLPFLPLM